MSHHISLYLFEYHDLEQETFDGFAKKLDRAQKKKLETLSPRKHHEFVISRTLLRYCLNHFHPQENNLWKIVERQQLPPNINLAKELNIKFSISHQASLIGIAISQSSNKLGFDLQKIKTFDSVQKALQFAEYFCSLEEMDGLTAYEPARLDQLSQEITKLWTMKEAYFKAEHCGIYNQNLKKTNLSVCANQQATGAFSHCINSENQYYQMALFCEQYRPIQTHQLIIEREEFRVVPFNQKLKWQGFSEKN